MPAGDIRDVLAAQSSDLQPLFESISEEQSLHRYAPDKWSIREVLSHVNDTERVFTFRALWFARGFDQPMPSFDQNIAVAGAAADTPHLGEPCRGIQGNSIRKPRAVQVPS